MIGLAISSGAIVGFSLGLTGGGGGIFAVPLLVYVLGVAPREAIGISLASVGGTALWGAISQYRRGLVEVQTGMMMAAGGMAGAPMGTWLAKQISESQLLVCFSAIMVIVAWTMWRKANRMDADMSAAPTATTHPMCPRDENGRLLFSIRGLILLGGLGVGTGLLSGLFGVGGGFVIVPTLVLLGGMGIHTAIATSLMIIFLVSISGVSAYLLGGGTLSWQLTTLFLVGGWLGMQGGSALSHRLSGPHLQRLFAVAIVTVAGFVLFESVSTGASMAPHPMHSQESTACCLSTSMIPRSRTLPTWSAVSERAKPR